MPAHPSRDAVRRLAARLGLPPPDPYSQDWEYEIADETKLVEWLRVYESGQLDALEMALLMKTLIASHNDALGHGTARLEDWEAITRFLRRDLEHHRETVDYWCLDADTEVEDWFPVTPSMRALRDGLPTRG